MDTSHTIWTIFIQFKWLSSRIKLRLRQEVSVKGPMLDYSVNTWKCVIGLSEFVVDCAVIGVFVSFCLGGNFVGPKDWTGRPVDCGLVGE